MYKSYFNQIIKICLRKWLTDKDISMHIWYMYKHTGDYWAKINISVCIQTFSLKKPKAIFLQRGFIHLVKDILKY